MKSSNPLRHLTWILTVALVLSCATAASAHSAHSGQQGAHAKAACSKAKAKRHRRRRACPGGHAATALGGSGGANQAGANQSGGDAPQAAASGGLGEAKAVAAPTFASPPPVTTPSAPVTISSQPVPPVTVPSPPVTTQPTESGNGVEVPTTSRWPLPALNLPQTILLPNGFTQTKLDPTKDYIVVLPPGGKVGGTTLIGGHNVVIVGGSITVPASATSDIERRGLYIKDATGTVHVEGLQIGGEPGALFDGIDISAPLATVELDNLRIIGVNGGFNTFHADLVQPFGGVKDLKIDHLTGTSDYQGLMLQPIKGPIGSAEISNVDITTLPSPEPTALAGGHMIWLTNGSTTCESFPTTLSHVYVTPREGRTLGAAVWPASRTSLQCPASFGSTVTWPTLPVNGEVAPGPAPTEFVPLGAVGNAY